MDVGVGVGVAVAVDVAVGKKDEAPAVGQNSEELTAGEQAKTRTGHGRARNPITEEGANMERSSAEPQKN